MAHLESADPLGLSDLDLQIIDLGARRAVPHPFDHLTHCGFVTLDMRFD